MSNWVDGNGPRSCSNIFLFSQERTRGEKQAVQLPVNGKSSSKKKMKKRNSNERAKGKGAVAGTACGFSRDSLCLSLIALVPFQW